MHGFRLIKKTHIKEIDSIARIFEHEKSGARLLHLENDDDNKFFSITFKTPPEDSTGLPHIMEHSVLGGSRKFRVKSPIIELRKGSLNTFLNAFTFPDKTIYPVASKNEKDLFNLMDVYLDGVLFPNPDDTHHILMQEGWHYELDNKDNDIIYNGVVYNEMKGALSAPDGIIFRRIMNTLLPDTPYGNASGGDPDVIPDLTIGKFIAFRKKYYHPSNSYLYLYGNGDLEKQLKFINDEYLQHFDKIQIDSTIPEQPPFYSQIEIVEDYPISPDDDENDRTYLSLNYVVGKSTDPERFLAFGILNHLLLGTPAAPLKNAILKAGIGKDVSGKFFGAISLPILQPIISIVLKGSNIEQKDKFKQVVTDTLQDLVKTGIDKKLIEASINIREFALREADYRSMPKGLVYNFVCLTNWLHDKDPLHHLRFEEQIAVIKIALSTDYFEKLITKYILENNHSSMFILKPHKGLMEKRETEISRKLERYKSQLSDEEVNQIVNNTQALRKRQQMPDSPEELAKMPIISLVDIDPKADVLPIIENRTDSVKVFSHPLFTNEIGYLNLYFDTRSVPQELIQYVSLLAEVMGKIDTDKLKYSELSNEINIHTGSINLYTTVYPDKDSDAVYFPHLRVRSKSLISKLPILLELLTQIFHSRFDNSNRIYEIIRELKLRIERSINFWGTHFAFKRAISYFSQIGKYEELTEGIASYKFIADLEKNYAHKADIIIKNLQIVAELIFNRHNLNISFTSSTEDFSEFQTYLNILIDDLWDKRITKPDYNFKLDGKCEGLLLPSKVQYIAKAYNFRRMGYKYTGKIAVLSRILRLGYLFEQVRVMGGAYGARSGFDRYGNFFFGSYRDPNLIDTMESFNKAGSFIREFKVSDREMSKYIIGAFSELDHPLTPSMKGEKAMSNYISHITQEDIQKERDEVLDTKPQDIREYADLITEAMKQDYYCVVGSEGKIKENKGLFGKLISVFE